MSARRLGWQQSPVPRSAAKCPHIGALVAALAISGHREGHEWVCVCGQVFVVVSNGGRDKRLVRRTSNATGGE